MAAHIKNADDLFLLLLRKEKVLQQFGLKRIGLFGSLARGEAFRDIDLLVEEDLDYRQLLQLRKLLDEKTGYRVDIVQEKFAEPLILHRAMKEICYAVAA